MRLMLRYLSLIFALALLILNGYCMVLRQKPNPLSYIVPPSSWLRQNDVLRVNHDGTEVRTLTADRANEVNIQPSPRGDWIVYQSGKDNFFSLYRVNSIGTEETIAQGTFASSYNLPQWSPNGKELVYMHQVQGQSFLEIMQADGTGKRRLTDADQHCDRRTGVHTEYAPQWIDDWIYFTGYFCSVSSAIYRIHPDGSDLQIVSPQIDFNMCWQVAPDHRAIFYVLPTAEKHLFRYDIASATSTLLAVNFACNADLPHQPQHPDWFFFTTWETMRQKFEVYRVRWDGSGLENITPTPAPSSTLTIGADWLYFTAWGGADLEIYRMRLDGTDVQNLTQNAARDEFPMLSPDGRWVYFISNRVHKGVLYRMNTDGTQLIRMPLRTRPRSLRPLLWLPMPDYAWHSNAFRLWSLSVLVAALGLILWKIKD